MNLSIKKTSTIVFLTFLALLGSQINYLLVSLNSSEQYRYQPVAVSFEFMTGIIVISGIIFLFLDRKIAIVRLYNSALENVITFSLMLCSLACAASIFYHELGFRQMITAVSFLLYFKIGKMISVYYAPILAIRLKRWLAFIPLIFLSFLLYYYFIGRVYFPSETALYYLQPHIEGGLRSAEIAVFLGLQLIYMIFAFKVSNTAKGKYYIIIISCIMIILFAMLFSIGAFLSMAFVLILLLFTVNKKRSAIIFISALTVFVLCIIAGQLYGFLADTIVYKYENVIDPSGIRGAKYRLLWRLASENPLFGIGWGKFQESNTLGWLNRGAYSHNNLLSMAAENGIIAALSYFLFLCSVVVLGLKTFIKHRFYFEDLKYRPVMYLLFLSLGCFIYIQSEGLAQDTWQLKEGYFWAGIMVGVTDWLRRERKRNSAF